MVTYRAIYRDIDHIVEVEVHRPVSGSREGMMERRTGRTWPLTREQVAKDAIREWNMDPRNTGFVPETK